MKSLHNTKLIVTVIVFLLLIVLSACGGAEATPTQQPTQPPATNTAVPSDTPAPTDTPEPTATFTPVPTDTPVPPTPTPTIDHAATQTAEANATAEAMLVTVKAELERIGLSADSGKLIYLNPDPGSLKVDSYNTLDFLPFEKGLKGKDFVLHADITWESTSGFVICGLVFRAEPDFENGAQYRFQTIRLSGLPSWDIERYEYNEWQNTASNMIVKSPSIDQENGATNRFTILAQGGTFKVFVNDDKAKTVTESKLKEGAFAYFIAQESGTTTCTFTNAWVWELTETP